MIQISDSAQKHFENLLKKQKNNTQLRLFVINPGTAQAECGLSYCSFDMIHDTDTEIKFKNLSIFIDEKSLPYLKDAKIDLHKNNFSSEIILNAPNAKFKKIDHDSSLFDRVNHLIENDINPKLATHGGRVSLIKITVEGNAILKFSGGCNGCSMVDITLKSGIEKELLKNFSELKGVQDLTEHTRGKHSFY